MSRGDDEKLNEALKRWFSLPQDERDRLTAESIEEFASAEIEYGSEEPPPLHAMPDLTDTYLGEENELAGTCIHCGWPIFFDTERDYETGEWIDPNAFWQHNDDRYYTPGRLSACPTEVWTSYDQP